MSQECQLVVPEYIQPRKCCDGGAINSGGRELSDRGCREAGQANRPERAMSEGQNELSSVANNCCRYASSVRRQPILRGSDPASTSLTGPSPISRCRVGEEERIALDSSRCAWASMRVSCAAQSTASTSDVGAQVSEAMVDPQAERAFWLIGVALRDRISFHLRSATGPCVRRTCD